MTLDLGDSKIMLIFNLAPIEEETFLLMANHGIDH